ncbi:dipeptidyl aminopeptidase/acylaminoacyl peptidase [Natronobacillus azotifigens]|uniref:S9 family peptidase n=1 Tax=Natronobacillus azotifigens TaxID=472978 RepID=A0A9J6RG64_9BACI|nr:S9 family peptidase [Natronobacillus azotifigens]MCZ0704397.1 S9 family peptidase [Natronobacillus azotifigens]
MKGLTAEDLLQFSFVQEPHLSPDGNTVVYVKKTINDKKKYQSNLHLIDLSTNKDIAFTHGKKKVGQPRFSPDGTTIAFVSNRSGKQQVWLIPVHGGEAKQLTSFPNGATNPVWSPDGKKLVVSVSLGKDDSLDKKEEEKKEKDELTPYVTTKLKYKADGAGFSKEKYQQLVLIELDNEKTSVLTEGEFDHRQAVFSPDGTTLALIANREEDAEYQLISDLYLLDIQSKALTKQTDSSMRLHSPQYAPDGKKISLLGSGTEYAGSTLTEVYTFDLDSKTLVTLTENWDVEASDVCINDMGTDGGSDGAIWSKDGKALFFLAGEKGATSLYQVTLDHQITKVFGEKEQIYQFTFNQAQTKVVYASSKADVPGDLYLHQVGTGEREQLTTSNQALLAERTLSIPEEIDFTGSDGTPLHGWITKPVAFKAGEKYPLIVEIHGGPHLMYSHGFVHEFQVLAEKGYGVLYINPRGSHGYGQAFVDAVRGDYGGGDYQDIMDAVDYALETFEWIDEDRLGVTGGSYGGFMTNWIVGHTNRFKAAVTQRSITNWHSFYGVSDIGYFFTDWELKADLLSDPDKLWHHSPIRHVNNIETPLLILHSEKDYRCPIEQAEQLYIALKMRKKPTKFVRYPESNHNLSRTGDPALRVHRLHEIVEWFEKYL